MRLTGKRHWNLCWKKPIWTTNFPNRILRDKPFYLLSITLELTNLAINDLAREEWWDHLQWTGVGVGVEGDQPGVGASTLPWLNWVGWRGWTSDAPTGWGGWPCLCGMSKLRFVRLTVFVNILFIYLCKSLSLQFLSLFSKYLKAKFNIYIYNPDQNWTHFFLLFSPPFVSQPMQLSKNNLTTILFVLLYTFQQ